MFSGTNIDSLISELSNLFVYFLEHYWLGLFFIFQILLLRFWKSKCDNLNTIWYYKNLYNKQQRSYLFLLYKKLRKYLKFYLQIKDKDNGFT